MTMKITINEASPRKFRAKPSDRGVGGKWGPADTTDVGKNNREQSVKNWKDQGTLDPEFKALLKKELDNAGTPFKINDVNADGASTWFIAKLNDFGINNIDSEKVGQRIIDCDDSVVPKNGIARLLHKICSDVLEDDEKGGAGVGLTFGSSDEDSYDTVWCDIFYPMIDNPDGLFDGELYPTRKEIVNDSVDTARKVTAYLKKMAPIINRESSRTFHESKCSMQKKIESFKKSKSASGRSSYDTYRAR